jgi:hypothetical protein
MRKNMQYMQMLVLKNQNAEKYALRPLPTKFADVLTAPFTVTQHTQPSSPMGKKAEHPLIDSFWRPVATATAAAGPWGGRPARSFRNPVY